MIIIRKTEDKVKFRVPLSFTGLFIHLPVDLFLYFDFHHPIILIINMHFIVRKLFNYQYRPLLIISKCYLKKINLPHQKKLKNPKPQASSPTCAPEHRAKSLIQTLSLSSLLFSSSEKRRTRRTRLSLARERRPEGRGRRAAQE